MNIPLGDTYYLKFTTRSFSTGAPTTLSGTPVVSVYEENNLTQITTGVTLTADYDSVTGLNDVAIVATSGNGYEAGKYYSVVITTGTVGGVSVVGEVVGHFRVMAAETTAGVPDVSLTAAGVDLIWDEAAAGHLSAGTVGLASALGSAALVDSTMTGTPTSTTFDFTGGSTVTDFYADQLIYILSGTGIGQVRPVSASSYSGGTTTITVDEAWKVTPAASDRFAIIVTHIHPLSSIIADSPISQSDIAAILTDTGTTIPATLGTPVADLATDIAGVQTDTTAIVADTNELQTDWANGGRLDVILDAILAMLDDPRAEPGQGAPAVNADLATKIDYLYKAWRNKSEQTATTYSLYDDAGTTVDQKATVSDDGTTATKGEIATGP